jgi:hypothetical protein
MQTGVSIVVFAVSLNVVFTMRGKSSIVNTN